MSLSSIEQLSLEEIECIDSICDHFAVASNSDAPSSVEEAVLQAPEKLRSILAIELIELEIEQRRHKGLPVSIDGYCQRFPQWSDVIQENFGQTVPPAVRRRTPTAIPGFELIGELGRGGMGVVYKARQLNLGRIVALKIAIISSDASRNELERFRSETESAARLKHPNIVQIYDVGEWEGTPFYTMEYIEGGNLSESMASCPLTSLDAAKLLEVLAYAVAFAHEMGVVHRDLKPSNILLQASHTKQGSSSFRVSSTISNAVLPTVLVPKLTDFGLAKRIDVDQTQTQTGTIIGTPSYMAPELIESGSKTAGAQADIYSLGAILYESLVGRPPFRAATMLETLEMARFKDPIPPSRFQSAVPRDLETICLKCLEKSPLDRYQSAAELGKDLSCFINGLPIAARPIGYLEHAWRWTKRKPILAGLIATIGMLLVALVVVPSILAIQLRQALVDADEKKSQALQSQRLAETRSEEANRSRTEAVQAAIQSQSRLVGMRINAGIGATLAHDPMRTMLWYEKAWHDDTHHSRSDREHRMRISSTLAQSPQMVGVCIHKRPIHNAVLNAASKKVLIWDKTESAEVWDPFVGKLNGELDHGSPIIHAAFNLSGTSIATCGGNSLKIWRSDTLQLAHNLVHPSPVKWMCLHPKSNLVLSAAEDGRIRLWDPDSGMLTNDAWFSRECALDYVQCSPDGRYILVIDGNGKLTIQRFDDQSILLSDIDHPLQANLGLVGIPQFLQGCDKLVTYSQRMFSIWDLDQRLSIGTRTTQSNFRDFIFTESGDRAVAATGTSLTKMFRLTQLEIFADAESTNYLAPRQTATCAMTRDGRIAAVSSSGGLISVVDVESGKLLTLLRTLDAENKLEFVAMPDGSELLFVASSDGTVRIWNLEPKSLDKIDYDFACGSSSMIEWIARADHRARLSADASIELRVSGRKAYFFDRKQNREMGNAFEHSANIDYVLLPDTLRPGSSFVVSDTRECVVRHFPSCEPVGVPIKHNAPIQRLRLSSDGKRLLVWRKGRFGEVWDTDKMVVLLGPPETSDDSDEPKNDYAADCRSKVMRDFDLSLDGSYVTVRFDSPHVSYVYRVENGSRVLTTDIQDGVPVPSAFASGARKFMVANSDTRARVWDVDTGQAVGPLLNHPTFVRLGCLTPDGSSAATWSADGKLRIWNSAFGDLILESKESLMGCTIWFRKDSQALVVHHRDGSLYELQLPELRLPMEVATQLLELFCNEAIDSTDGIVSLPTDHFREHPERFLNAWRAFYKDGDKVSQPATQPTNSQ